MQRHQVAVLNRSTVIADAEAKQIVSALQQQLDRDFAPAWGISAVLSFVPSTSTTGWKGKWNLTLLDSSDVAGALGYHDLTPDGLPLAKVFAKDDQASGSSVSVTTSHELLEMLLDPFINLAAQAPDGKFYAMEACDPVEADALGYSIGHVQVSDFILPGYFGDLPASAPYDFRKHLTKPLSITPGGYVGVYDPAQGWTQVTADGKPVADPDGGRSRIGLRGRLGQLQRSEA